MRKIYLTTFGVALIVQLEFLMVMALFGANFKIWHAQATFNDKIIEVVNQSCLNVYAQR